MVLAGEQTNRIRILNTEVDDFTLKETVESIRRMVYQRKNAYVVTPNLDHLINLDRDPVFAAAYKDADLILADGISLIWLSKLFHTPLKEKVSGSDLFPALCAMAGKEKFSLFILGAAPGVARKAAENLAKKNPGLSIAGTYSPPFGYENDLAEIQHIIAEVKQANPDIMVVSLGDKKGEKFLYQYRDRMCVPVSLSLGAAVDYEANHKKRAPHWVSACGFEWLYRAIREPGRIGRRVLRDIAAFIPLMRKYR